MASLSYRDEHLAWQQRVSKQIGTTNRFFQYFLHSTQEFSTGQKQSASFWNSRGLPRSVRNRRTRSSVPQEPRPLPPPQVYLNPSMQAEVRGKYATYPKLNHPPLKVPPGIASRPSTQNSLIGLSQRNRERRTEKQERIQQKSKRPLTSERVRPKTRSSSQAGIVKKLEYSQVPKGKEIEQEVEEPKEGDEEEEGVTEVSFGSSKQYIEELEKMLREERIRRIELEQEYMRLTGKSN